MDAVESMLCALQPVSEARMDYELEKRIISDQLMNDVRSIINRRGPRHLKKYWAKKAFSLHLGPGYSMRQIALITENKMSFCIQVSQFIGELMGIRVDAAFIKLPLNTGNGGLVYVFRIERSDVYL